MNERHMTLATDWDFRDVRLWQWSEKFDGCRAYWDGQAFWTRGGHVVDAPAQLLRAMPSGVHLDGELWAGRGGYIPAMNFVRHGIWSDSVRFVAFDAPQASGDWLKRMKLADGFCNEFVITPERGIIRGHYEASERAAAIIEAGGEGLMLRSPNALDYQRRRTVNLMRIKTGNLYAPWYGATPQLKLRDFGGLRLSEWPFDPKMEHEIIHS